MLDGNYIIGGVDIWMSYGAVILKGSYNSLLSYPDRKKPDQNDWFEEDGIEVDLTSPKFDAKSITISLGIYASSKSDLLNKRKGLLNLISSQGYKSVYVKSLNYTYQLRYIGSSNPSASSLVGNSLYYLEQDVLFSMDNPFQQLWDARSTFDFTFDFTFRGLSTHSIAQSYKYITHNFYSIGQNVINYGMSVTKFNADALVFDSVKEPLLKSYSNMSGIKTDLSTKLKYKEKTINLGVVMAASTIESLLSNYSLFFRHIGSSGIKTIHNIPMNMDFKGYYSKQSNLDLFGLSQVNGDYVLQFDLEFTITQTTTL